MFQRDIETSVEINASVDQVWRIFMDTDKFEEWNPFIKKLEGDKGVGQQLIVHIYLDPESKKPEVFTPTVMSNETNQEFSWEGKILVKGIFNGHHYFRLEKLDDTTTKFIHGEHFSGILVPPIWALIGGKTKNGFEAMNEALKERAESK